MTERTKYQKFEAVEIHRRDISGAPWNPRSLAPANRSRLKKGVKKHGIVDTLVFNKRTGQLVGGHQRLSVLDELEGSDDYTITVQQIDVDENEEMLLNMALNNPSLQGQFDADLQRELFEHLMSEGVDVEGAGYTTTDVQVMYPDIFATGQLAEQLDAESDIVNELHDMARVGKEYETEFRDAMGLEPTKAMRDRQERDIDDAEPERDSVDYQDTEPPQHANGGVNKDWSHDKDYYNQERQRVKSDNAVQTDADVLLTFAFQTKAQLEGFIKAFNLPGEQNGKPKRYFDVHDVSAAFGVDL